jgi:heme iron utilization protein
MAQVTPEPTPGLQARLLLRAARAASLATVSAEGQPFASLVTPCCAPDGALLMLLSGLSEHTRYLRAEPRCSLMVVGTAEGPNPQTAPRVTVTGVAETVEDPALRQRWVTLHPYARFYADLTDFSLWRVRPMGGLFVGGFARAARLRQADLTPDPEAVAAIEAAAASILEHCNREHADALTHIAHARGRQNSWCMLGVDVDGFDLVQDEDVLRVAFSAPVSSAEGVRQELMRLAAEARHR